jgi:hypothetical protein
MQKRRLRNNFHKFLNKVKEQRRLEHVQRSSAGLARLELQAAKMTATNHGNYSSRSREWQRSS